MSIKSLIYNLKYFSIKYKMSKQTWFIANYKHGAIQEGKRYDVYKSNKLRAN
jgi:hypothetical protein